MTEYEYSNKLILALQSMLKENQPAIASAISLFADAIINDNMIHVLGTGHSHMIGLEGYIRAGGLGNINAILDSIVTTADGALRGSQLERIEGLAQILWSNQKIEKNDLILVISNSGRNAIPIEFAQIGKNNGNNVIAITSAEQSTAYPSRHSSGLKLMDIADIVLDNKVPTGDGLCVINERITGAFSSIAGITLMNLLCTEAQKKALEQGVTPYVFHSQNIDGYNNQDIYGHFGSRLNTE